jgi:hypothetical protein
MMSRLEQAEGAPRPKYKKPGAVFRRVVHRLDRPVSGISGTGEKPVWP